jgi:two-component system CheB/CheR fusion protein
MALATPADPVPAPTAILPEERPVRIVGIGASAGGVEAYSRLLKALPAHSGMAYVLVPHLSPHHPSELPPLLARLTPMPVTHAVEGEALHLDHVYVLPADKALTVIEGRLHLGPRLASAGPPSVIDEFLQSLAVDVGARAVGVILSGTGSDGTLGLGAIKSRGGITYAQDSASAVHDSMPRSAAEAGCVDFVLPPEAIAQSLADLAASGEPHVEAPSPAIAELSASETTALETILDTLRAATGVDFRLYRRPGMLRRIHRRVDELGFANLAAYVPRLRNDPSEIPALFSRVLIHVTEFFRDPETFQVLGSTVIPRLLANRPDSTTLRIWVAGCATGEEAYSIAISLREVEAALGLEGAFRLFATDVSEAAITTARLGRYPSDIGAEVSPERLERFFTPLDGGYLVDTQLREMCVFARHDITRDPPFAQMDLVVCRNLLIYLEPALQERVLHNLHYALKPAGILLLGAAETVGEVGPLFSPLDPTHRVYLRRAVPSRLYVDFGATGTPGSARAPGTAAQHVAPLPWPGADLQQAAEHAFFEHYPCGSVIVDPDLQIVHFQGRTSPYLEVPTGGPTVQLLKMAHPDLRLPLARLIRRAHKEGGHVRRDGIAITIGSRVRRVSVTVLPLAADEAERRHDLVVFEPALRERDADAEVGPGGTVRALSEGEGVDARIQDLERELVETREYLQAVVDQHDAAHAQVEVAYQASLSANEEYQSTNEELESTKEELQSLNEELTTLNEQLQQRNVELSGRTAQIAGLLEAMDMPILLLTPDLGLLAFNSRAAADLRLSTANLGRSIRESWAPVPTPELIELIDRALTESRLQEREFQDPQGYWSSLRIWPIPSVPEANRAVVVALVDITRLKEDLRHADEASAYSEAIVDAVLEPLLVLDRDLKIVTANRAFHRVFETNPADTTGVPLWELGGGEWNRIEFRGRVEELRRSGAPFDGYEMLLDSPRGRPRTFRLSGRRIVQPGSQAANLLVALEDITDRNLLREQMIQAGRIQAVAQLAGGVAHEMNNQMTAVLGFGGFLLKSPDLGESHRADLERIVKAAQRAAEVTRQLLAFSRRQALHAIALELNTLVANSESLVRRALGPDITLELSLGESVGQVRVDEAQMEQILVNLALNARDAMLQGGRLAIETTSVVVTDGEPAMREGAVVPRGAYFRLVVRDTGCGMDEPTRARIFEPFFTTKPPGQGTGLGLAGVYGTVKQSGGLIWVESEPGRGTTFTIDLPAVVASAPPKAAAQSTVAPGGSETIVVVDDEELVRKWACRLLSGLGYNALEASGGGEALRLIAEAETPVALVVSDVIMPGMSGVELRNRLAEIRPRLPVLLMSGFAADELIRRGVADAATSVLQKPVEAVDLASKIRERLDMRGEPQYP